MTAAPRTITLATAISELSRLMTAVDGLCGEAGAASPDVTALHLALEELATNVITHGYGGDPGHSLTVTLEAAGDRIRAVVADDAPAYNPLARPEVDTGLPLDRRPVGGLGVHLVRKLMDVCIYEHRDGRNLFTIERRIRRPSGLPAVVTIAASRLESTAVLALSGRLDGLSSPELEHQVSGMIRSGIRTLEFDLSALDYVSSAGLRVFLVAAKEMRSSGGGARFTGLNGGVREVFEISGLLTVLDISPRRDAVPPG